MLHFSVRESRTEEKPKRKGKHRSDFLVLKKKQHVYPCCTTYFVLLSSAFPRNAELEERIWRVRKVPGHLRGILTLFYYSVSEAPVTP